MKHKFAKYFKESWRESSDKQFFKYFQPLLLCERSHKNSQLVLAGTGINGLNQHCSNEYSMPRHSVPYIPG